MSDKKTGKSSGLSSARQATEQHYPARTYLFFGLVGSSILFLSLLFMYVLWISHNTTDPSFRMPKTFFLSTVLLMISSYTFSFTHRAFEEDNTPLLLGTLTATLLLAVSFTVVQLMGWKTLYEQGFFLNGEAGITFLYIVSGIHMLHLGGGMLYLFYLNLKVYDNWNDPVKGLLYFSNRTEGLRLSLFSVYWHFMDILWLVLFFIFLFSL